MSKITCSDCGAVVSGLNCQSCGKQLSESQKSQQRDEALKNKVPAFDFSGTDDEALGPLSRPPKPVGD